MLQGGCFCGRVRYEVTGIPFDETICHCSICRRTTGAAVCRLVQRQAVRVSIGVRHSIALSVERERNPQLLRPLRHPADFSERRLFRRDRHHDLQPRSSRGRGSTRSHAHEQKGALDSSFRRDGPVFAGAAERLARNRATVRLCLWDMRQFNCAR